NEEILAVSYFAMNDSEDGKFDRVQKLTVGGCLGVGRSEFTFDYTVDQRVITSSTIIDPRGLRTVVQRSGADGGGTELRVTENVENVTSEAPVTSRTFVSNFDVAGRLTRDRTPQGLVTDYRYFNDRGRRRQLDLEQITVTGLNQGERVTEFQRGAFGTPTEVRVSEGGSQVSLRSFDVDGVGLVREETSESQRIPIADYNPSGTVSRQTDLRGEATDFSYDEYDEPERIDTRVPQRPGRAVQQTEQDSQAHQTPGYPSALPRSCKFR
ncbi:MAG: hypothetical protein AAFQ82_21610, partial [Myxococcota bacterium]